MVQPVIAVESVAKGARGVVRRALTPHALLPCMAAAMLACLPTEGRAADGGWDVANTGEPGENVTFKVTEGTWMSLDVSPDGRTLVFDLLGDIYSMPASGGTARAILDGPAMQRSPMFSADGTKLLFLSDASGDDNAWIANADGSGPHQITRETVDVLTGPAWGPDGDSVIAAKMSPSSAAAFVRDQAVRRPRRQRHVAGGNAAQSRERARSRAFARRAHAVLHGEGFGAERVHRLHRRQSCQFRDQAARHGYGRD